MSRELAHACSRRGLIREVQLQSPPRAVPCELQTHRGALQGVLGALSCLSRRHPAQRHWQPQRSAETAEAGGCTAGLSSGQELTEG